MKTFAAAQRDASPCSLSRHRAVPCPDEERWPSQRAAVRRILRGDPLQAVDASGFAHGREAATAAAEEMRQPEPRLRSADQEWPPAIRSLEAERCVFARGRKAEKTAGNGNGEAGASRGLGDWTLVDGFPVDNRYCFCEGQIEKELDWVRFMADLFRQCRQEVKEGTATDAVACKTGKLKDAGIATELVGSVDSRGRIRVDDWPGPCGPIFRFGVRLHETVHQGYVAHGQIPVLIATKGGRPEKQKELRELSEVSAREYSANEIKAYRREERYLQKMLRALAKRCTPGDYLDTDPGYYAQACGELDLEMGLDFSRGAGWGRRDVEGSWPGLRGKCWWYLDHVGGGGYNCYGYCLQNEIGLLRHEEPALRTGETMDDYFQKFGYERTGGAGEIALFSESHVARRSQHTFQGKQLWESKLGPGGPLILHQLKDLEGTLYGTVVAYYSRVSQ